MSEIVWLLIGLVVGGGFALLGAMLTLGRSLAASRADLSAGLARQEEIRNRLDRSQSDTMARACRRRRINACGPGG